MEKPYPKFFGRIDSDGQKLLVYHPEYFRAYRATLAGKEVEIILKKRRKQRTTKHNSYWHGIICQIVGEWMGETVDGACRAIKRAIGRPYYWREKDKLGNEEDRYWSTADMTGSELHELEEHTKRILAEFRVIIPEKEKAAVDN